MSGQPQNVGLGQLLAQRRQTTSADVWRNPALGAGKRAAPVLHESGVALHLVAPSARALRLLADWGVQKADRLAELPYDADVLEGDELHASGVVYQVERAAVHDTLLLCAVWEVRRAAVTTPGAGLTGQPMGLLLSLTYAA